MRFFKILLFYISSIMCIVFLSSGKTKKPDYKVSLGDTVHITLNYTAGTGYMWQLVNQDELSLLEPPTTETVYTNQNGFVGGTGSHIWHFASKGKGTETLVFVYKRPWEDSEIEKKEILVKIK